MKRGFLELLQDTEGVRESAEEEENNIINIKLIIVTNMRVLPRIPI